MSNNIQKVSLSAQVIEPIEIEVKIPTTGEIKPSKVLRAFSGFPKVEVIQTYTTTNYIPGKVTFDK